MPLPHRYETLKVNGLIINKFQRFFLGTWQYSETVHDFNYTFEFGKSYLLDAKPYRGAFAVSWAIGGLLKTVFDDTFYIDEQLKSQSDMRNLSWCEYEDGHEKWWKFPKKYKSVARQIREGLKETNHVTEDELRSIFEISEGRYERPLYQHSGEHWRSSPAIGYAKGKIIYCFPHLDLLPTIPLLRYRSSLELVVKFLTENGALVIIPAIHDEESEGLCDVVVPKILIDSHYKSYPEDTN